MEANNRMTFSQFVELLPMAFGEETGVPMERETLTAIDQLGRASYTTRSGFAMTVEKGFPEERCAVRLRTNIAFVYPVTMDGIRLTSMLTYLQYAISTSKISITNNAEILERQVSLFDLTPERVESEIAKFCKNCFCALTMLEHSVCPIGHQEKIRRMVMPAKGVPNPSPEWAQLPASESSLWKKNEIELGQIRIIKGKDLDLIGPEKTSESQLFPPSAKSNQLSHLRRCNDDTGPHDHVRHWRTLHDKMSYLISDTPENVSRGRVLYDVEATHGFWYQTLSGVDLYFQDNPCDDGDGDICVSARIKTLNMNEAGAKQITGFVNAYNASPYVGTLSFDTDSTLTLWRAMNLETSKPGEVQRALHEFSAAICDIDEQVTSLTHYLYIPSYPYVGVGTLSKPQPMERLNEPSFKESLLSSLRDFGEDGKFAGLDRDAIQSIDIKSLDAPTLRDICLARLTRFNYRLDFKPGVGGYPVFTSWKTTPITNATSDLGMQ